MTVMHADHSTTNKINHNFEVKSSLAKLLAVENINIKHDHKALTAYFDLKSRLLILPIWNNISEDLYDMLVVHEVGHALYTPADKWLSSIIHIAETCYVNYNSFNELTKENIIINVKQFINVVEDIRIDKLQKRRYPGSKRNYVIGQKELHEKLDFFGLRDRDIQSMSFIDRVNIYFKSTGMIINFSSEERSIIKELEQIETFQDVINHALNLYNTAKKLEEMNFSDTADKESVNDTIISPSSLTMIEAEKSQSKIVNNDIINFKEYTLPSFDRKTCVDDFSIVLEQHNKEFDTYPLKDINQYTQDFYIWKKAENSTISFMVKEFELRKAANIYSKTLTAKTGIIDMNKLIRYKFDEDLFKRSSIVKHGKNHGFFMLLDWSLSMRTNILSTIKQLLSLTLFCKRVGIPFEVYLFRSLNDTDIQSNLYEMSYKLTNIKFIKFEKFKLRNILSSRMNIMQFNNACKNLWITTQHQPSCDLMRNTPLNQAIIISSELINEFQKNNKIQIVSTIILSDGESTNANYFSDISNVIIKDSTTNRTYMMNNISSHYKCTSTLLRILKDRTNSNIVGFYLHHGETLSELNYMLHSTILTNSNNVKSWNKHRFFSIKNLSGYDEHYIMNSDNHNHKLLDQMSILPNMNNKTMTKMFMTHLNKKNTNRIILKSFINRISKDP